MDRTLKPVGPANVRNEGALVHAYLCAKCEILNSVYKAELLNVARTPNDVSESQFLQELAWVILSGGMSELVIRNKFGGISAAFLDWRSARSISDRAEDCIANALCHFRHEGKIRAIASAAHKVAAARSFEHLKDKILRDPIRELQSFAYIGPITAFHIAKNMGIGVSKPDRHLTRLARSNGFRSVDDFCGTIAYFLGEDIRRVDSVLWRFATMHRDYLHRFSRFRPV